jgi:hypothetical protein
VQYLLREIKIERDAEQRFRIRLHGGEVEEPGVDGRAVANSAQEGPGSPAWQRARALGERLRKARNR